MPVNPTAIVPPVQVEEVDCVPAPSVKTRLLGFWLPMAVAICALVESTMGVSFASNQGWSFTNVFNSSLLFDQTDANLWTAVFSASSAPTTVTWISDPASAPFGSPASSAIGGSVGGYGIGSRPGGGAPLHAHKEAAASIRNAMLGLGRTRARHTNLTIRSRLNRTTDCSCAASGPKRHAASPRWPIARAGRGPRVTSSS